MSIAEWEEYAEKLRVHRAELTERREEQKRRIASLGATLPLSASVAGTATSVEVTLMDRLAEVKGLTAELKAQTQRTEKAVKLRDAVLQEEYRLLQEMRSYDDVVSILRIVR